MYATQEKERTQARRAEREFAGRVSDYAFLVEQEREQQEQTRAALLAWRKGGR
jgi:hypothetical protein